MIYLDETGFCQNLKKDRCWEKYGTKAFEKIYDARFTKRINLIGSINYKRSLIAPCVFEGNCDTEFFLEYVKQILMPELTPGLVIVWDNASFHKSKEKEIRELFAKKGCELICLPPYSPDLNPIERHWFFLKKMVIKIINKMNMALTDALNYVTCFKKLEEVKIQNE